MTAKSARFHDRTRKLHRLLTILRKIDNRERCTPQALAQEFGTTERNIFRDINDLISAGFSILFDRDGKTYRFTDPDFTLRDLDLNNEELKVLLIGRNIAHRMGEPFEKSYKSLFGKIHKDTGIKTQEYVKRLESRQQYWVDITPTDGSKQIEGQYNAVVEAMDKKEEIEVVYKGMGSQKVTTRNIAPYGLMFHEGLWYVLGHCSLRKDIRMFALDCIKKFKITGRRYEISADFNMDDYFKPGWHMIRYGEPVQVVLKFTDHYARWIKRKKWHPTQIIEEQKDGSIIFKVTVEGTDELKWWTYHWIPYCKIISPPELRREVEEEMKEMLKEYEEDGRKSNQK